MMCYDYYEYAKAIYSRKYSVTLEFNRSNVDEAYRVYLYAVMNNKGIVEAIKDIYGYRYRRMENFMKEIGFYKPGLGWALVNALVKTYSSYRSAESINVEGEVIIKLPLGEIFIDEDYLASVFYDLVERSIPIPIYEGIDVGVQCLDVEYSDTSELRTTFTLMYVKEKRGVTRDYTFVYTFKYDVRNIIR